jgi:uncharacterized protein YfbU (UPF0304 family)
MTIERLRWQIHLPAKLITPISSSCCHLSAHIVAKIVERHNEIVYREISASNICVKKNPCSLIHLILNLLHSVHYSQTYLEVQKLDQLRMNSDIV